MFNKELVICILARDCEKSIATNKTKIEKFRKSFIQSSVIIVENDSKDNTRQELLQWQKESVHVYLPEVVAQNLDGLERIERLTICRNVYLQEIKKLNLTPDYLLVIDIDTEFYLDNIEKIINDAPEDWAALFANGSYYVQKNNKKKWFMYYDLYAFIPYNANTIHYNFYEVLCNGDIIQKALKKQKYVKCNSAFGGVGLYKYDAIKNAEYKTIPHENSKRYKNICEHILFNQECKKSGNLYVAKDLRVDYEEIKGKKKKIWYFLKYALGNKIYISIRIFYKKNIKKREVLF